MANRENVCLMENLSDTLGIKYLIITKLKLSEI